MPGKQQFCHEVVSRLTPCGPVMARAMFGGYGLYCEGIMFALISDNMLYFKVDDLNREDYERAGMGPFIYEGKSKPVTMSYYRLPDDVLDNVEVLSAWIDKARAAAIRAKRPKQSKSRIARH
ncbi:MAG: TfoX/Sxy family protein [Cyanobacteria bacterium P01_D01_bin.123]